MISSLLVELLPLVIRAVEDHLIKRERDPEYKSKVAKVLEEAKSAITEDEEYEILKKLSDLKSHS